MLAMITIAIAIGMLPTLLNAGKQIGPASNLPNAIVTSCNCNTGLDGLDGLDYVAWVNVSVLN